jgi:hypothetical protein
MVWLLIMVLGYSWGGRRSVMVWLLIMVLSLLCCRVFVSFRTVTASVVRSAVVPSGSHGRRRPAPP